MTYMIRNINTSNVTFLNKMSQGLKCVPRGFTSKNGNFGWASEETIGRERKLSKVIRKEKTTAALPSPLDVLFDCETTGRHNESAGALYTVFARPGACFVCVLPCCTLIGSLSSSVSTIQVLCSGALAHW